MLPWCLKWRKNTESKNPKVLKTKNGEKKCFYQDIHCVIVKNQIFLKNKKLEKY